MKECDGVRVTGGEHCRPACSAQRRRKVGDEWKALQLVLSTSAADECPIEPSVFTLVFHSLSSFWCLCLCDCFWFAMLEVDLFLFHFYWFDSRVSVAVMLVNWITFYHQTASWHASINQLQMHDFDFEGLFSASSYIVWCIISCCSAFLFNDLIAPRVPGPPSKCIMNQTSVHNVLPNYETRPSRRR